MKSVLVVTCLFFAALIGQAASAETTSSKTYLNETTGESLEITAMTLDSEEDARLLAEVWINGTVVDAADDITFWFNEDLSENVTREAGADRITIVQVVDQDINIIGVAMVMQRDTTVHLMVYLGDRIDKVSAVSFMIDFVHDGVDATPPEGFEEQPSR